MPDEPKVEKSSAIGWAILAVAALVALVDIAIETFWSGSPVRWWVAPPALVLVGASAWLWWPTAEAAKKWGWQGAASWSVGCLLFMLAVSAWIPGGQSTGVRMFLQPTATVFTVVTAGAILLAALVLFRSLEALPSTPRLVSRCVVAALAAYALASLGLALREHTSFASLFQGGAAWNRLPRWLQGSFIGAFALLPLAVLGQALRIAGGLRRKQPLGVLLHQGIALVIALVMAVSGLPPSGGAGTTSRPSGARVSLEVGTAAASLAQLRRESVRNALAFGPGSARSAEETVAQLEAAFGPVERLLAMLPRTGFDPKAVVEQVGTDPVRLFEWVRDETAWVPYRGELRGAIGVLMDRTGNSLDRALLLAALLGFAGLNVRLAHGTLTAPQVDALLAAGSRPRTAPSSPGGEVDLRVAFEGPRPLLKINAEELQSVLSRRRQGVARFADAVRDAAQSQSLRLMGILPKPEPAGEVADRDAAADHWWVQVDQGGTWTDLDPSLPTGRAGTALTSSSENARPDALAPGLRHRVAVRVIVEQLANGRLGEHVALEEVLNTADLVGVPVSLVNVPRSHERIPELLQRATSSPAVVQWAQAEKEWQPVLLVGDRAVAQQAFGTTGSLLTAQAEGTGGGGPGSTAPPSGLAAGFLGGAERQTAEPPSRADAESGELTAEWIEYEFRVPGRQPRRVRREVFDIVGPSMRAAGSSAPNRVTEADRFARTLGLLSTTEAAVLSGGLSREFLALRRATALLASRSWMIRAAGQRGDVTAKDLSALAAELRATPGSAFDLAVAREQWSPAAGDTYLAEPNVIVSHRGLSGSSLETLRGFTGFDIVSNEVAVRRGAKTAAYEARLRQGVFDSVVENVLMAEPCCGLHGGVPDYHALEDSLDGNWALVRSPAEVKASGLPPDAQARIAAEIAAGYVVAVGTPASNAGSRWWRINPRTGSTVAVGSRGWGQGMLEYIAKSYKEKLGAYFVWEFVKAVVCLGVTVGMGIRHHSVASVGVGLVMCTIAAGMGFAGAADWVGAEAAAHAVHQNALGLEAVHYFLDALLEVMSWGEDHEE